MFYYSKEDDLVCNLNREAMTMNFGHKDYQFQFEEDGITVRMNGYTYYFYPSIDHPRFDGNGNDYIHLYPVHENLILHSDGSYLFRETTDVKLVLKEAYIMLRRAMAEKFRNPDGSINKESFDSNINEAYDLSKKILFHLDRDDEEVELNRQKIENWAEE